MKTIFTLLLATIFSFTASADDESLLTITIAQANAEVLVNGRVYRPGPDRTVTIHDIRPGRHRLEVYQRRGHGHNHPDRRRSNLLYASTISIRPFHHVDVMINRFGKALIDEQVRGDRYDDADDHYGNADAAMRDQNFLVLK
ncbi:MAG TPA: hypothetical protein VFZ78_08905, partial [Flavisolibacter sp.]